MKRLLCVLIAAVMVFVPPSGLTVQAVESWREAYAELLRKNMGSYFALHDMDGNGMQELIIKPRPRSPMGDNSAVYTFSNAAVQGLGEIPLYAVVEIPSANDIRGLFTAYSASDIAHTRFFSIQNGNLHEQIVRNVHRGFWDFGEWALHETVYTIENNITTRSFESLVVRAEDSQGAIIENRTDTNFDSAMSRLQGTPLQFHPTTEANIATHIYGATATANSHPFAVETWQEAYTRVLRDYAMRDLAAEWWYTSGDSLWFSLLDIDLNGIPELIITISSDTPGTYTAYTFADGQVTLIDGSAGLSADIQTPSDGSAGIISTAHDIFVSTVRRYALIGNSLVEIFTGDAWYDYYDTRTHWEINGREVTVAEGNRLSGLGLANGRAWISGDRITEANIQSVISNWRPAQMATPPAAPAQNAIGVTIDGQAVNFADQPPTVVENRTLVPVRGVFEHIGFYVTWNGDEQQATLTREDFTVIISVGSATFTTNGASHTLDVPAQIINYRTMLPIRTVLESVGYYVGWANNTVIVSANPIPE